jgi:hypothetical protein
MEMDEERLEAIMETVLNRIVSKEINPVRGLVAKVQASYLTLSQETGRLHEQVRRLLGEPRCPTCGRSNKPRRGR